MHYRKILHSLQTGFGDSYRSITGAGNAWDDKTYSHAQVAGNAAEFMSVIPGGDVAQQSVDRAFSKEFTGQGEIRQRTCR